MTMNLRKILEALAGWVSFVILLSTFYLLFSSIALADTPPCVGTCINLTYPWSSGTSPAGFVATLYQASLGVAAACALGVIVFGAVLYTINAGNVSKQSDARSWMTAGVAGLVLLLAAYVILWTINPSLVTLTNPGLETINNLPTLPPSYFAPPQNSIPGSPLAGTPFESVPSGPITLTTIDSSLLVKPGTCGGYTCQLDADLNNKLTDFNSYLKSQGLQMEVTEAWPLTYSHRSSCHNNGSGTCVDYNFLVPNQATPSNINEASASLSKYGLSGTYEVATVLAKEKLVDQGTNPAYISVDPRISGSHFHINLAK